MSPGDPGGGRSGGPGQLLPVEEPDAQLPAERGVLGALLHYCDPKLTLRLLGRVDLTPECFYWEAHGAIFAALVALAKDQIGGDEITVNAEMERSGTGTEQTREMLRVLPSYVPAAGNYVEYGERVVELARWRERRRVALDMIAAVDRRNEDEWKSSASEFLPKSEREEETTRGPTVLRLVNEVGHVVGEETYCESCNDLKDQLDGAQKEIAGWRTRYANLERDKDRAAMADALWLPAQALFEYWKTETNHKGCKWNPSRFRACEPMLKAYGIEMFARAIVGIAYQPYTEMRRNGTLQRYDSWETLTKTMGGFEEYANRAPKGWKFTLNIPVSAGNQVALTEGGDS